jgi:hypothetical protein
VKKRTQTPFADAVLEEQRQRSQQTDFERTICVRTIDLGIHRLTTTPEGKFDDIYVTPHF